MGNLLRGSTLFQFFVTFVNCFSSCFTEVQIVPYQLLTCTKPHSSLDHYFCSHSHHVAGLLVFRPVLFSERSGILSPYGRGRLPLLHRNLCPAFIVFNTRDNSFRSPRAHKHPQLKVYNIDFEFYFCQFNNTG